MFFFKPYTPNNKKEFIKNMLGFIAIILRKNLKDKDELGNNVLGLDYLKQSKDIVNREMTIVVEDAENRRKNV